MKRVILLTVLLTSCGNCGDDPCDRATLVVNGLCVIDNDYSEDSQLISGTINITEEMANQFLTDPVDLSNLLEREGISLKYVEDLPKGVGELRGTEIKVEWADCETRLFTLGHELLHVIQVFHLGKEQDGHNVPGLFFEEDGTDDLTADLLINRAITPMCERLE